MQIRLMIAADTDAYLEKHASPSHSKGAIVDELLEFYTSVVARLMAIQALLETRHLPPASGPVTPADPVPDPDPVPAPSGGGESVPFLRKDAADALRDPLHLATRGGSDEAEHQ